MNKQDRLAIQHKLEKIEPLLQRVSVTEGSIARVDRAQNGNFSQLKTLYDILSKDVDRLRASYNKLEQDYYLQRAKDLGYDKRITLQLDNNCRKSFTIDDNPTEYSFSQNTYSDNHTLYADQIPVNAPQEEIDFLANMIKALQHDAASTSLTSISDLFDKKETKK